MDKKWLTEELDNTPYFCSKSEIIEKAQAIEENIKKIDVYLTEHPKLAARIYSEENFRRRLRKSALSFLSLETNKTLDIVPAKNQTMMQKLLEEEQVKSLKCFEEACQLSHEMAEDEKSFMDERMFVKLHCALSKGKDSYRVRLRNETDGVFIYGKGDKEGLGGYFSPVDGDQVSQRISMLLFNFDNTWKDDNYFVRCAKFVAEYVRIQPHMDGNKRVAVMLLNYLLEKQGYSAIYFSKDQLDELYLQIKNAILERDVTGLTLLIERTLNSRYNAIIEEIRDYRLQKLDGTAV